jgi:hypothetical protein
MDRNKILIKEELKKSDVTKELKNFIDSKSFESKIEKIIKDRYKNDKELEDKIVDITKNVLTQLYKTLWIKRATWINNLDNKTN